MSNLAKFTQADLDIVKDRMLKLFNEETYIKEVSFAMQAINQSEYLQKCSKESLQKAVYNTATTGLSLNPVLKFASLVPRYINGSYQCVLEPQYQGLVKLITDTGSVKTVYAHNVMKGDEFEVNYGTETSVTHRPKFASKEIEYTYAIAILHDGTKQIEVMNFADICAIRGMSESYKAYEAKKIKSCIWVTHEGEMAKKTVIKRLVKYLPKTDRYEKLAEAVEIDNSDYTISDGQQQYLLSLLNTSVYGKDDTGEILEKKILSGISKLEFDNIKRDLEQNQIDPISAGFNYNQTDIKKKIAKEA